MMNNYELKRGVKTRILNIFRNVFRIRSFEAFLVEIVINKPAESFWARLIPPNYLYPKRSIRSVVRDDIVFELDISDHIEHAVYFGCSDISLENLKKVAKNKKAIIDVGVNIGSTLLNFAKICKDAQIIGFEPDSANFQKANNNLNLNDFSNAKIINKGLGDSRAAVRLYDVNRENAGMKRVLTDVQKEADEEYSFEEIEIIRLDDYIKENNLDKIDLIKIDVEGYELKVLRGAEQLLKKFHPTLFIELDDNNLRKQNDSALAMVFFLKQLEYEIYNSVNNQSVTEKDDFANCHFDIICQS